MTQDYHYSLAQFGPSEVARITGVSPDLQRDWRRRGIIFMDVEGRAVFHTTQVAQIMVRKALSDIGVPLTEAAHAALMAGLIVQMFAERESGATEIPDDTPQEIIDAVTAALAEPAGFRFMVFAAPLLGREAFERALADRELGTTIAKFLPALPASTFEDVRRMANLIQKIGGGDAWSVIDLGLIGARLARAAERPLSTVVVGPSRSQNRSFAAARDGV